MKRKLHPQKRMKKEMKKNELKNMQFQQWFTTVWTLSGGLTTNATAARLLNKTTGRISQMIKEGKLKEHKFDDKISYIEILPVLKLMHEEKYKKIKKEIQKNAKIILPNDPEKQKNYIKTQYEVIESDEKCMENNEQIIEQRKNLCNVL